MRSPLRVLSGRRPETMPAIQMSASEPVSSATRRAPKSVRSRAEALERMPAHVEAERFLLAGELLRSRSTPARRAAASAPARRRRRRLVGDVAAERAETVPSRDRAGAGRRARAPRSTAAKSRARRTDGGLVAGASESSAPALTRLSSTRLLTSRRSTCSHSVYSESIRPRSRADGEHREHGAFADVLDRARPNRTPSGTTENASSLALMSGGRIGTPSSRHSPRYIASLSVLAASIVRSAAMKCRG